MFYNIQFVKNGVTVDKESDKAYEQDTYVFTSLDDALTWIKTDSVTPTS